MWSAGCHVKLVNQLRWRMLRIDFFFFCFLLREGVPGTRLTVGVLVDWSFEGWRCSRQRCISFVLESVSSNSCLTTADVSVSIVKRPPFIYSATCLPSKFALERGVIVQSPLLPIPLSNLMLLRPHMLKWWTTPDRYLRPRSDRFWSIVFTFSLDF